MKRGGASRIPYWSTVGNWTSSRIELPLGSTIRANWMSLNPCRISTCHRTQGDVEACRTMSGYRWCQTLSSACGSRLLLKQDKHIACGHLLVYLDEDLAHDTTEIAANAVLHFHRLNHAYLVARRDDISRTDV